MNLLSASDNDKRHEKKAKSSYNISACRVARATKGMIFTYRTLSMLAQMCMYIFVCLNNSCQYPCIYLYCAYIITFHPFLVNFSSLLFSFNSAFLLPSGCHQLIRPLPAAAGLVVIYGLAQKPSEVWRWHFNAYIHT